MLRQTHSHIFDVVHSSARSGARTLTVTASCFAQKYRPRLQLEELEKQTPRWIRRQSLQKGKAKEEIDPSTKQDMRPRSKTLSPSAAKAKGASNGGMKLLEPYVLSQRLLKLCDHGKMNEAVSLLTNSPLVAQNVPVWNTVIWEAMKRKRYKLAYKLYVDMKRRGHSPTTRTYSTMFNGLARIEDFSECTQQLKNARSLFDDFIRHLKSVKRFNPTDSELSIDPLAYYIKILGKSGCYTEIFEIFYSLEPTTLLPPNPLIFTSIFQALATRPEADTPKFRQADARLLWAEVVKASQKDPSFVIDSHLTAYAISALAQGQTLDHDLAFQISRDFYGLCPPGVSHADVRFPLASHPLYNILRLCNISNNHDLCIEFFNQVKRRPANIGGVEILDRGHLEEVLRAHQALSVSTSGYQSLQVIEWMLRQELTGPNGGNIRPQASTFNLALVSCWRSADWNSTARLFDLMTGYHLHDFMDGAVSNNPRFDQRSKGRNIPPTPENMSTLVRTAYASRNRAHMRQCLRLVDYLGVDTLFSRTTDAADESRKSLKNRGFFVTKLAQGIVDIVDYVLSGSTDRKFPAQFSRWKELSERAKMELRESGETALIPTLQKEARDKASPLIVDRGGKKRSARMANSA